MKYTLVIKQGVMLIDTDLCTLICKQLSIPKPDEA